MIDCLVTPNFLTLLTDITLIFLFLTVKIDDHIFLPILPIRKHLDSSTVLTGMITLSGLSHKTSA